MPENEEWMGCGGMIEIENNQGREKSTMTSKREQVDRERGVEGGELNDGWKRGM
jgi:hypothetical protein